MVRVGLARDVRAVGMVGERVIELAEVAEIDPFERGAVTGAWVGLVLADVVRDSVHAHRRVRRRGVGERTRALEILRVTGRARELDETAEDDALVVAPRNA